MARQAHWFVAAATLACVFTAPAPARADVGLPGTLPSSLRLLPVGPSLQFDDGGLLSFIPKGDYAQAPWEVPIVVGQFAASAAVNLGAVALFSYLAGSESGRSVADAQRSLLTWGLVQFAVTPLASASAVWGVGSLSYVHSVSYGWPLAINYVVELLLVAAKIGIGYGLIDLKGGDVIAGVKDLIGPYLIVDWLLHGIVVPATVTYFSIRSRTSMGYNFARREVPLPARALARPALKSVVERRDEAAQVTGAPALSVPLLATRF